MKTYKIRILALLLLLAMLLLPILASCKPAGDTPTGDSTSEAVTDAPKVDIVLFENGETAVAAKGKAVYSALPFITSPLLRELLRDSGVFIYSDDPKVYTYVGSGAICAYNATDGEAVISVREDGEYLDGISGERFSARNGKLTLPMRELRAYMLIKERNEKEI